MMMPRHATIRPLARRVRSFIRDESGVMAVQVLFFFFMMLLVGGVAVDLMRFEARRVAVQQTMDRATLAAANLENILIPQDVVTSYFTAADLGQDLKSIHVTETPNGRTVRATATVRSDNYFMSMMDVPYLEADSRSQAEQRINDVEVLLVLDVSGSMSGTKLTALKSAANNFLTTVMENDPEGRISIGIIPYNAQVNLGQPLRSKYTLANVHGVNNADCLELPAGVFSSLNLSRSTAYPMMAIADVTSGTTKSSTHISPTSTSDATPVNGASRRWCNPGTNNRVTLPTKNLGSLTTAINALQADGNTSILLGMRWATALMAPEARSMYGQLISEGAMSSEMSGRPFDYDNAHAMKVIVLMTDGQHVAHDRVVDAFKTGTSPIYRSRGDGNFSIFHDRSGTTADYWVPHRASGAGEWRTAPWNSGAGVDPLQWQDVWSRLRVSYVAWNLYARALSTTSSGRNTIYNNQLNTFLDPYMSVSTMDSMLAQNCNAAREAGILIYGIAFQAPAAGQAAIRSCASQPHGTYYYAPDNSGDIGSTFDQIAATLSRLRLTQ